MQWINRIKPFIPLALRRKIRALLNLLNRQPWRDKEFARLWRAVAYKWGLQSVTVEDNSLKICGWAVAPPEDRARLRFTCNDQTCAQVEYPLPQPDLGAFYPYIPYAGQSGFTIKIPFSSSVDPRRDRFTLRCFDQSSGESPGRGDRPHYFARRLPDDILPDDDRIFRVAGFRSADFFFLQGYNLFRQLDNALQKTVGRGLADFSQVLDWGCGCGRVALHFRHLPSVQLTGADVDGDNIGWCQGNLSFGRFLTTPLHPPLPFESDSFDLIFGVSVFTHLREQVAFEKSQPTRVPPFFEEHCQVDETGYTLARKKSRQSETLLRGRSDHRQGGYRQVSDAQNSVGDLRAPGTHHWTDQNSAT